MLKPADDWSERSQFINCEFICQLQDDETCGTGANNPPMTSKPETFNTRFARLKEESGLSFSALAEAIYARTGMQISHTALHKYMTDGNIDEPTLEAVAKYFGKTPAWFRYGIGETPANTFELLGRMVADAPDEPRQMVLQLLRYEFADNATRIVSEPGLSITYAEFIDRVIKDMEAKRAQDAHEAEKPTKSK